MSLGRSFLTDGIDGASRTRALVVLEGYIDPVAGRTNGVDREEAIAAYLAMWGTGEFQRITNPDMPWNEEIRATWARHERLAASPRTIASIRALAAEIRVRAVSSTLRDLVIGSGLEFEDVTSSRVCPANGVCSPSPRRSVRRKFSRHKRFCTGDTEWPKDCLGSEGSQP